MIKRRLAPMSLCVALILSLISGCGATTVSEENIELLDPVGVSANYVKAEVRDLVAYKTYAGKVVPVVQETSFASDQRFSSYSVLPGSIVKAGDAIISANTELMQSSLKQQSLMQCRRVRLFTLFLNPL